MSSDSVNFQLGEIVYFKVDDEKKGVITGIVYRPDGVAYMVTWNDCNEQTHFSCELTTEKAFSENKA